jgi:UDP-N-acetylmuramoyl-L-alanyl-D-glutamate--2,6-diaminopimelate ligase
MKPAELLAGLPVTAVVGAFPDGQEVTGITKDSREVGPGTIFFVTPSSRAFLADALARRPAVVVSEEPVPGEIPCLVLTANARLLLAQAAARLYGFPSRRMHVTGITGTNGKTTVSYLIESIVGAAGEKAGVIGTISYRYNGREMKGSNTTPESVEIQSLLAAMGKTGVRYAVMEVSSHALDQGRVECIDFDCAVFTNLTHDHLDYHGDFASYRQAKSLLFHRYLAQSAKETRWAVLNTDDPSAPFFVPAPSVRTATYSGKVGTDAYPVSVEETIDGIALGLSLRGRRMDVKTPLVGLFNVSNILAAALAGDACGFAPETVAAGISALKRVPGRLDRVETGRGFYVFVDYAHTPDALEKTIETLNRVRPGRLIVVFGCGGDRDRAKRPVMGRIAASLADFTIITSDNPRTEKPAAIIGEIRSGIAGGAFKTIEDRKEAIAEAIAMAGDKDVVLVAGKGHEDYQIVGKTALPFSDRAVIEESLRVAG